MARLAGQGITAIKDVCFNDAPQLMNAWDELEKEDALLLRVSIVSQPVSAPVDLAFGEQARRRFHSPWLRFHGFKFMVDGVIADHTGDMIYPMPIVPARTMNDPLIIMPCASRFCWLMLVDSTAV